MFFKYINEAFVFLNIKINFIDFLKDVCFVRIFKIYIDTVFYNDIQSVLEDLYIEVRRYRSYRWFFGIGGRIGGRFFVWRDREDILFK